MCRTESLVKVVIGGSLSIRELPKKAEYLLDRWIIQEGREVLVGDAPGVDRLVQEHLYAKGYTKVTVYHAYQRPRNNVGGWQTVGNFTSYTARDKYMCELATAGLFIWDGRSRGTGRNISQMKSAGKPVVIIGPTGKIVEASDSTLLEAPQGDKTETMERIVVLNMRGLKRRPTDGVCFRVDRGTALGNPFVIGRDGDRDQVCDKYEAWIQQRIKDPRTPQHDYILQIYRAAKSGNKVYLLCWCAPARCHAETIKRLIEEALSR